jgi:hypothetical protein
VDTIVYAECLQNLGSADVRIDADVQNVAGPNWNNISLVCRMSPDGWYEAAIDTGGYWSLWRYSESQGFEELKGGASTAIRLRQGRNHMTLVCAGATIAFYVNDVALAEVEDDRFDDGHLAIGVTTFELKGAGVNFEALTVTLPDPANPPGGAAAPTVPPSGGGSASTCRLNSLTKVAGSTTPQLVFSADGFGPNEQVLVSLAGTAQSGDVHIPMASQQLRAADALGRLEGEWGWPLPASSQYPGLVFALESGTCQLVANVTWP